MLFSIWSFHKSGHIRQGAKLFSEIILLQPFVRRAPHLVPRRVTSPLLWKHWATNETIFTKFGFKGFPFWPIEGGLHFCWLEKREFCYWTPYLIFVIFFTQAKFLENKIYRLQETTCFHTTVRIYPAKSGTGNIL